jgi:crossover junction endodeoxyribonuclease RusA
VIELVLPYPPTANKIWIRAYKGMRLAPHYERWLASAGIIANAQRQGMMPGRYKLSIDAVRPDRKKRDLDNIIKPISDLLVKIGSVQDDSLCEMISARWVTTGEGVTVRIEAAGVE